jgi:hypothetical protein
MDPDMSVPCEGSQRPAPVGLTSHVSKAAATRWNCANVCTLIVNAAFHSPDHAMTTDPIVQGITPTASASNNWRQLSFPDGKARVENHWGIETAHVD